MEIILSKQCLSLTGCLGRGYGYYIRRARHNDGSVHFFSQRSKHPPIPRDGHLRFIFLCAELAQTKLHVSDILVPKNELQEALREAGLCSLAEKVPLYDPFFPDLLNASDIINFKNYYNL